MKDQYNLDKRKLIGALWKNNARCIVVLYKTFTVLRPIPMIATGQVNVGVQPIGREQSKGRSTFTIENPDPRLFEP